VGWLYDSTRDYLGQLAVYREYLDKGTELKEESARQEVGPIKRLDRYDGCDTLI